MVVVVVEVVVVAAAVVVVEVIRRRNGNDGVLSSAGESQDSLLTDNSSSSRLRERVRKLPAGKEELRVQLDREHFFLQRSLPHHSGAGVGIVQWLERPTCD